jgi:mannose-1-phosphate guanylyltransferase/phosphomannomutase
MRAIILCGGMGSRIAQISGNKPKALIDLDGKNTILDFQIDCLIKNGITSLVLVTGIGNDQIKRHILRYTGKIEITIIFDIEILGTLHALRLVQEYINDETLLIYGDLLMDINLLEILSFRKKTNSILTVSVHPSNHVHDSDVVRIDDTNFQIVEVIRKGTDDMKECFLTINGVFALSKKLREYLGKFNGSDFSNEFVPSLIKSKEKVTALRTHHFVKDVGTPERLTLARQLIAQGKFGGFSIPRPAIFLDRDGTINSENRNVTRPQDFIFVNGTEKGIKILNDKGYLVVVVTNQPIVAKGYMKEQDLKKVHNYMEFMLAQKSAKVDLIEYCTHHPQRGFEGEVKELKIECDCRKPANGMFHKVLEKTKINIEESWMLGNTWRDEFFAIRSGLNFAYIGKNPGQYLSIYDFNVKVLGSN